MPPSDLLVAEAGPAHAGPAVARGFLFPGQGSQHVGMGADLISADSPLTRLLRRTEELTGHRLKEAMLLGPPERLDETIATQLSTFVLSLALAEVLRERGLRPALVAGHSLGEFAALVVGGWLDEDAALVAVTRRAEAMAACCARTEGTMSAVVGVPADRLDALCAQLHGRAVVANRNSPRQSVIAGKRDAVEALGAAALEAGASAVIALRVKGAFHSPLMAPAQEAFASVVSELPLRRGVLPLVSSITGAVVGDVERYREQLSGQISAPVRWTDVMGTLRRSGVPAWVEVGPGRALRGLLRHADRGARVAGCDGLTACQSLLDATAAV